MGFDINNSDNIHKINGSSEETSGHRRIVTPELIRRCLIRPTDEAAWVEFIRRFNPTIRTTVEKSFQLKETEGEKTIKYNDEMIEAVVQMVYFRLIENRGRALRRIASAQIKPYLQMISINTALKYLRNTNLQ